MKQDSNRAILAAVFIVIGLVATAGAATVATPPKTGLKPPTAVTPSPTSTQTAPKTNLSGTRFVPCTAAVATTGTQTPTTGGNSIVGPLPTTVSMGPNYVGPTPDITAVANAFSLRAKSLTTLIAFKTGVTTTKPVAITVDYSSPAAQYRVGPQAYDICNGNRYLYNDPISGPVGSPGYSVWGRPREMDINITLSEANPAGQPYVYNIPLKINLDPLFDVSVTPMNFTLNSDCAWIGDSNLYFYWTSPDGKYHDKNFATSKGKLVTINEFAWTLQEASASGNVFWPQWAFHDTDFHLSGAWVSGLPQPTKKLLPMGSGWVGRTINSLPAECSADIGFNINTQLHTYSNL
jgi:hypothetical protein